jgi:hypothetical protein
MTMPHIKNILRPCTRDERESSAESVVWGDDSGSRQLRKGNSEWLTLFSKESDFSEQFFACRKT